MSLRAVAVPQSVVEAARLDAVRAAEVADVEVRAAALADLAGIGDVLASVWGPGQRPQPNLLMALAHAGATVASAVRGGSPVGACVGFLGWNGGLHLHSHMAAVRAGVRTTGIGFALKLWQRATCLEHGVSEIRWTFDPLVRRNAAFNLRKLGATVVGYRPDFYGEMDDIVNADDHSDRFEVSWALDSGAVRGALAGDRVPSDGTGEFVALPEEYDVLRREAPSQAREVREHVRDAIGEHWAAGLRPVWSARGGYLFQAVGSRRG